MVCLSVVPLTSKRNEQDHMTEVNGQNKTGDRNGDEHESNSKRECVGRGLIQSKSSSSFSRRTGIQEDQSCQMHMQ